MNETIPIEHEADQEAQNWQVRLASHGDVTAITAAVSELLVELGGKPPDALAMQATTRALLEEPKAGALLVAETDEAIVGVLAVSWQTAIHIPGRYALIQDLWVHPSWRNRAVGRGLVTALTELASEQQVSRIEVGLPREHFAGLRETEAFYLSNGFTPLGQRMRRISQ